ncbi:MAG TPA: hypothetical protein VN837_20860 [Chloroflexota bacterium]|nr:hypothetical protein [Chloroflexota bacterium]
MTPVLMGNGTAIDLTSNTNAKVTLNLIDPDSIRLGTLAPPRFMAHGPPT